MINYLQLGAFVFFPGISAAESYSPTKEGYNSFQKLIHLLPHPQLFLYGHMEPRVFKILALSLTLALYGFLLVYSVVNMDLAKVRRSHQNESLRKNALASTYRHLLVVANHVLLMPAIQVTTATFFAGSSASEPTYERILWIVVAALALCLVLVCSYFIQYCFSYSLSYPEQNLTNQDYNNSGLMEITLKIIIVFFFNIPFRGD